jgi:hypothetical protein
LCRLMAAGMRIQGYPAAAWATLTPFSTKKTQT